MYSGTQMPYPSHISCCVVCTCLVFFHENLIFHGVSPRLQTCILQKLLQWAQAGVTLLVTGPCTALAGSRHPGHLSLAAGLPNIASAWAGDAQLCPQNTLYVLSLTLERLPQAEPLEQTAAESKGCSLLPQGKQLGMRLLLLFL